MVAGQMVAGELVEEDRWQAEVESRFAAKRGRAGGFEEDRKAVRRAGA